MAVAAIRRKIMTVNPVNSGSNYVSQVQPQPQSQVERAAEKENDKDVEYVEFEIVCPYEK